MSRGDDLNGRRHLDGELPLLPCVSQMFLLAELQHLRDVARIQTIPLGHLAGYRVFLGKWCLRGKW